MFKKIVLVVKGILGKLSPEEKALKELLAKAKVWALRGATETKDFLERESFELAVRFLKDMSKNINKEELSKDVQDVYDLLKK